MTWINVPSPKEVYQNTSTCSGPRLSHLAHLCPTYHHLRPTNMTTIDSGPSGQMESLIGDLNAIRIDPPRPTSLRIDTMFSRAAEWKSSSTPSVAGPSVQRAPSPARRRVPFPQPKPLDSSQVVSPLGQLFDYSELLPYVLRDFERPSELAVLARVNRAFNEIATKQLYEHVWMRPCESESSLYLDLLTAVCVGEPGAHEKVTAVALI